MPCSAAWVMNGSSAHSNNSLRPISKSRYNRATHRGTEAPTRLELQQKIQANISAALAAEFPGLKLPAENQELKFNFHIEAKPGGGFIIHSHDPKEAAVEGATHEEIEHPFAEKLAGVLGKYFMPELSQALANQGGSGDVKVFVNRQSFTTQTGSPKLTLGDTQYLQPAG